MPTVSWSKLPGGEDLGSRANMEIRQSTALLEIEKANRYDAGKYMITAQNGSGKLETTINVTVYGMLIVEYS